MTLEEITLAALILVAALLYSSVGHAGASGYLAAMALVGISPAVMKPTAFAGLLGIITTAPVLLSAMPYWAKYRYRLTDRSRPIIRRQAFWVLYWATWQRMPA
jgi:hypothetical protein